LQKDLALAHFGLGQCLANQGKNLEAIESFHEAIRLNPDGALIHCTLGNLLAEQGLYAEAIDACRRGDELGRKTSGWAFPSAQWLREAERMAALAKELPAFLRGDAMPDDAKDRLLLGRMCLSPDKVFRSAARFFAAAYDTKQAAAEDLESSHRLDAARAAVLAAAGLGDDTAALSPGDQARLRKQALSWLQVDLLLWSKKAASSKDADRVAADRAMKRWRAYADLASVRAETSLAKLPREERTAWREFWAGTDAVREQAQNTVAANGTDRAPK
jgi:tetratricopeptide (TPR) repeat protein